MERFSPSSDASAGVAGLMMCSGPRAGAQGLGFPVAPSATSMLVSNSLTYAINVTNLSEIKFSR